jgi:carotenoid cleavage dioxygenase
MWEWDGSLPTMVGVLPRDGEARDVRWFKGPARNTLHFLNASDGPNDTVTMELPVSDEERSPSHIKRWTFNLNSRNDAFGEEVMSRSNGVLARMDDRYLSLPYRYGFVGHNDPERPYDTAAGGNRAGRVTNCYRRFDLANPAAPESTFFVGNVQSLQECGFIPRKGSTAEGDGYVVGIASNYAEMASELHIADAQRMEEGAVAVVKLPFRLRGGTHVNWFSADELAAQRADTV